MEVSLKLSGKGWGGVLMDTGRRTDLRVGGGLGEVCCWCLAMCLLGVFYFNAKYLCKGYCANASLFPLD